MKWPENEKSQNFRTLQTSPRIGMKDTFRHKRGERLRIAKLGKNLPAGSVALYLQLQEKSQAEHMGQDPISCSRPDRLLGESGCSDNVPI